MPRYKLRIDGPVGKIETEVDDPGPERRGLALVAHPHPQHGGSMNNKVVTTIAKTLLELGYVAVRLNYRGVGKSEGTYGHGEGEVDDTQSVLNFVSKRYPDLPLVLAGFSFGAMVQCRLSSLVTPEHLLLVSPAVNLFEMGNAPPNTIVIHGEKDELVPIEQVRTWAQQQSIPLAVVPNADHFFNRKLSELKQHILTQCPC